MRLVVLAPYCDGTDVGESHCAFEWVRHLAERFEVTLLTLQRQGRQPVPEQLAGAVVITWPEPAIWQRNERLNAMLKPAYWGYYRQARRWLRAHRERIDMVHQIAPLAMRYPCPATGLDVPYVIGPLGGSLRTPMDIAPMPVPGLGAAPVDKWYARLRSLDHWRFAHDPWLRRSYAEAAALIGVGDYVAELLRPVGVSVDHVESELGIDRLAASDQARLVRPVRRLLHVGRGVRMKGLQEAVQCLADLADEYPELTLTSAGQGPEIARCQQLAEHLGIASRCRFLGQVPREQVEALYQEADIFLFPSLREPSGSVVFEAMRHGLPPVVAAVGGPGHVVNETAGMAVKYRGAAPFRAGLAAAVKRLIDDRDRYRAVVAGARERVVELGHWPHKIDRMAALYRQALDRKQLEKPVSLNRGRAA